MNIAEAWPTGVGADAHRPLGIGSAQPEVDGVDSSFVASRSGLAAISGGMMSYVGGMIPLTLTGRSVWQLRVIAWEYKHNAGPPNTWRAIYIYTFFLFSRFGILWFSGSQLPSFSAFSCFSASLLLCFFSSWLPCFFCFVCFFASLLLWFSAFPCFSAFPASLLICLSLLTCFSASLLLPCFSCSPSNCRSTLRQHDIVHKP